MAKKPEKRYQTGAELAAAAGEPWPRRCGSPVRDGTPRRGRGRGPASGGCRSALLVVAAVLVLVGAGAVGAWKWWDTPGDAGVPRGRGSRPSRPAVPADIRADGKLIIGVNVPYAAQ